MQVTLCDPHHSGFLGTMPVMQHMFGYGVDPSMDFILSLNMLQYEMLVDKHARKPSRRPHYELRTFYGQLQHIYVVRFLESCRDLGFHNPISVILAVIRTCVIDNTDPQLLGLDIRFTSNEGALDVVDITNLQCLVGRIRDRDKWAIIDRSGNLARALYVDD
jgi:hypothetical protein